MGPSPSKGIRSILLAALALTAVFVPAPQARAQYPQSSRAQAMQPEAEQLLALANQSRSAAGAAPLQWDPALAAAARQHCLRMAAEGPIAHQYRGELNLQERAAQAGARFSLIEENVAIGPDPSAIHNEWMNSPGHRSNLLNPEVDRVGVAVVASRGVLYAAADYAHGVEQLLPAQVEATVASLVRVSGVTVLRDPATARAWCAGQRTGNQPMFFMRWQDADLTRLPQALVDKLASGQYRQAAIGSCPADNVQGTFSAYKIAVLLY